MIRISKTFDFSAAHRLEFLNDGHKCKRLHGHNYKAELIYEGEEDEFGMLIDFSVIADVWNGACFGHLDHRYLNDVPGLKYPTSETIARWIFGRCQIPAARLVMVRLYESASSYAEYSERAP